MRCCPWPENCSRSAFDCHRPSPREGNRKRGQQERLSDFPTAGKPAQECLHSVRWRANQHGKVRVDSSLSSIGHTHIHPVLHTWEESVCVSEASVRVRNPCWVQEELIVRGLQQVEVELGMEEGKMRSIDRDFQAELGMEKIRLIDGDFCAEEEKSNIVTEMLHIAQEEEETEEDVNEDVRDFPQNEIVNFVALMKDCAEQCDLRRGNRVHADLIKIGLLDTNVVVGNTLVNMYAKCGALQKAQEVFEKLPAWSVVSWNVLLAGYTQHGHSERAIYYFERMQSEGFYPNAVTFTCILKACGSIGDSDKGQDIHAQIVREGLLEINIHVGTALVDMYAKCGLLPKAQEVFDKLPARNIISWTALIIGYAQYEHGEEALNCFEQMQLEGFSPDAFTFACSLKACCSIGAFVKGQEIHAWIIKECLLERNIVVASALVDMYAKCGALDRAQDVFNMLPFRDTISWTALISAYALHGHGEEALYCYEQMHRDGIFPNAVTFAAILKACCSVGASDKGQEIHAQIIREGLLGKDVHVGTALVDMYAKCGFTAKAEEVFDKLQIRDVATWTALITAYAQSEQLEEAVNYFEIMQLEGIFPDAVTFSCLLTACGSVAAAYKGQKIHVEVIKLGLIEEDMVVGTALVDMYVNCGMLVEAQDVFDKLQVRDVVSWSALMAGYAQLGREETVFKLFDDMIVEGEEPNVATFTIVLNTCSHRGLLDKGQQYFEILSKGYGIIPNLEQHTCMVDLFGRAGHLDKAVAVIIEMSISANLTLWTTLLSACRKWGNPKLGRLAFDHAIQLDEKDGAAYICMNNIYAAAGMQEDADKIEAMRVKKQAWSLDEGGAIMIE